MCAFVKKSFWVASSVASYVRGLWRGRSPVDWARFVWLLAGSVWGGGCGSWVVVRGAAAWGVGRGPWLFIAIAVRVVTHAIVQATSTGVSHAAPCTPVTIRYRTSTRKKKFILIGPIFPRFAPVGSGLVPSTVISGPSAEGLVSVPLPVAYRVR